MKETWRRVFGLGVIGIVVTGCSLLLGPLSSLSLKSLLNAEWKWTWVGDWTGNENEINVGSFSHRYIRTYRLVDQKEPGFFVFVHNATLSSYRYIHFSPTKERRDVESGNTAAQNTCPYVYVSEDQKEFLFYALSLNSFSEILWYDGKSSEVRPVSSTLISLTSLGEKAVFAYYTSSPPNYYTYLSRMGRSGEVTSFYTGSFHGDFSVNAYLFTLEGDSVDSSLVLAITNYNAQNTLFFFDSQGNIRNEKTIMMYVDYPYAYHTGVVIQTTPYLMALTTYGTYSLMYWNGSWINLDSESVVNVYTEINAIDMVAVDNVFWAAWVVDPQKIRVRCYRHLSSGVERLLSKDITVPVEKGNIEGIDFFYDKAGGRVILGVLHAVPPDNHIGLSYWTIPAW